MLSGMRHLVLGGLLAVSVSLLGCGSDGGSATGDDAPTDGSMGMPDSPTPPPGYTRLIGRTWSIAPGSADSYKCVRFTVPQDTYITDIVAQAPAGTHHTVLTIAGANGTGGADGEQDCSVGTLGMVMLYASGVGTDPLNFPQGVGLKIAAGTQIHLNLHLFNATDQTMAGDSAIYVKTTPTAPAMLACPERIPSHECFRRPDHNRFICVDQPSTGRCDRMRQLCGFGPADPVVRPVTWDRRAAISLPAYRYPTCYEHPDGLPISDHQVLDRR